MRRLTTPPLRAALVLAAIIPLQGCTGFGEFLGHAFSGPYRNPNAPMTDSENVRRVLGRLPEAEPLQPEPGNVWPAQQGPDPTLSDLAPSDPARGFAPTTVPGAEPGLPAGRQPRPRGSSTPPEPNTGAYTPPLSTPPLATPNNRPRPQSPQGNIVQTPGGPAVDAGGTNSFRQLTTPQGPGAIMVPNGNGTSTIINPNGTIQTVPTPR